MTKIPKFRAWHSGIRKMLDVSAIDFVQEQIEYIYDDNVNQEQTKEWFELSDVVLMQSTGQRQYDGKEVFEMDIVNIHWFTIGNGQEAEVYLENRVIYKVGGTLCFEYNGYPTPIGLVPWHEESFEVVGNIYENPEWVANLIDDEE